MKLALIAVAVGAGITITTPPRPPFPGPVKTAPEGKRLVVVSSLKISPGLGSRGCADLGRPFAPPDSLRGLPRQDFVCPKLAPPYFVLYGKDGASARILLSSSGYAFDLKNYVWPPSIRPGERGFVYEEIVWAREAYGVLYVENAHLTYAKSSYNQNAYITAFDVETKRRLWRSKALVANAHTFAVTPKYVVTGYGFTEEDDWLYLLDRRRGRAVERLKLPSAPEFITRRGKTNFIVRTYDHVLTVKLRAP